MQERVEVEDDEFVLADYPREDVHLEQTKIERLHDHTVTRLLSGPDKQKWELSGVFLFRLAGADQSGFLQLREEPLRELLWVIEQLTAHTHNNDQTSKGFRVTPRVLVRDMAKCSYVDGISREVRRIIVSTRFPFANNFESSIQIACPVCVHG